MLSTAHIFKDESIVVTRAIISKSQAQRDGDFVWLSGIRWAVEQCFEETKTDLGMDQYEVRKFAGWNHHFEPHTRLIHVQASSQFEGHGSPAASITP